MSPIENPLAAAVRIALALGAGALFAACGGSTPLDETRQGVEPGTECTDEEDRRPANDGCNTCTCSDGHWACTERACESTGGRDGAGGKPAAGSGGSGTSTGGRPATGGRPSTGGQSAGGQSTGGSRPTDCSPGDKRMSNCQTCVCNSRGTWDCDDGTCNECMPGVGVGDGCNSCTCVDGQWTCTNRYCPPECPPPAALDADVACPAVVVYARDPESGTCCEYGDPCRAPAGWTQFNTMDECMGGSQCKDGETRPAGDGCNTCTCFGGFWSCTQKACIEPKGCGGWLGDTCSDDEYCAYQEGQHCGAADASAFCQPRPTACTREYAPVCGCDGTTYSTACVAASAGTGVLHAGECGNR